MSEKNPVSIVATAIVAIAVLGSMYMLSGAIIRSRSDSEMIRVTGSARKEIRSDFIIWSGRISYRAPQISAAYTSLQESVRKAKAYLVKKGIPDNQIVSKAISTQTLFARPPQGQGYEDSSTFRQIEGYELSQVIEVRSDQVDLVDAVSREATELISQGVPFQSESPQYIYTKIGEEKIEILAKAAEDARRRAEEIAKSSGARIGTVRFARMSPLQITPIFSYDVSGDGINDTSSLDKAITAIVSVGFSVK
jgi:hypothetical protein